MIPSAGAAEWLAFLDALWPQEPDAIDVLGEWFGYVVSAGGSICTRFC